ncbi:MAG: hypothetical protein ABI811_14965 [Acidobacteriota bacterium]
MRISPKDTANLCELFKPRVTVVRDGTGAPASSNSSSSGNGAGTPQMAEPRNSSNARAAFDNLFRKPE